MTKQNSNAGPPSSAIRQAAVNGPIPSIVVRSYSQPPGRRRGRLVVVGCVTSHPYGADRAFLLVLNQNAARHRYQRTADRQRSGRDEIRLLFGFGLQGGRVQPP